MEYYLASLSIIFLIKEGMPTITTAEVLVRSSIITCQMGLQLSGVMAALLQVLHFAWVFLPHGFLVSLIHGCLQPLYLLLSLHLLNKSNHKQSPFFLKGGGVILQIYPKSMNTVFVMHNTRIYSYLLRPWYEFNDNTIFFLISKNYPQNYKYNTS